MLKARNELQRAVTDAWPLDSCTILSGLLGVEVAALLAYQPQRIFTLQAGLQPMAHSRKTPLSLELGSRLNVVALVLLRHASFPGLSAESLDRL